MAAVRAVGNLVERILGAAGPLPAWCAEQRKLAGIVAEALDVPPRDGALVTLTQAATGTGTTIALLAPLMALAALQKRQGVRSNRATLSTFTNHLTRQILEDDAPRVNDALEALGYPVLSVATRVGRRRGAARAVPAGDGRAHPERARCGDGRACGGATGGGVGQRGFRSGGRPSGDVSTRHIARRCGHRCRCSGVRRCTPERRRRGIPDRRPTWDVHAGTVSHGTPRRCAGVDGRADVRTGRCARGARPCSGPPNPGDGSDS